MFVAVLVYVLVGSRIIKIGAFWIADVIGLWVVIKRAETDQSGLAGSMRRSGSASGSGSFGGMSGSARSKRSRGGGDSGGVTARMKSSDLMHAFLEQNRPWMLQNLANIFTSEFLARNPPWVVR